MGFDFVTVGFELGVCFEDWDDLGVWVSWVGSSDCTEVFGVNHGSSLLHESVGPSACSSASFTVPHKVVLVTL